MQTLAAPKGARPGKPDGRIARLQIHPPDAALAEAVERLRKTKRPVIIVGHGAGFDMPGVTELAEKLGAPVITTFKGKGLISDDHPLAGGVLGRSGTPIASWFMNEADLLLVLGASFSNHTGITPKKPTIQVDFDAMTLGKFFAVDVPVWGELSVTVARLKQELSGGTDAKDQRDEVAARWKIWREEKRKRLADDLGRGIASAVVFDALNGCVPEDAIIAVDVGNNTYSFGRYFECRRQAVLMSGYLGSIGFSFPAAMGAWAATQEDEPRFKGRPVVSISGDGGFGQYMAEMLTAVKYGMNITHILLNNSQLGKISKEQRSGQWEVWQTSLHNPSFAEYAKLCGAFGERVTKASDVEAAVERGLAHDGPALIEIVTDAELV